MKQVDCKLSAQDYDVLVQKTKGYSSADLNSLCKDAAMEPVREIPPSQIMNIKNINKIRPIMLRDFERALISIRPSVSNQSLREYYEWHQS